MTLRIANLSVAIHGRAILRDVSLTVAPGKITAITGESGSGKSMTALAVMGLLPEGAQASGRIELEGQNLLTLPEAALCGLRGNAMGMVFQEPMTALNPVQTIGDQVTETLRIHGTPRGEAASQARETLARVGLAMIPPDRYPHQLSGGQRQRVVIAAAIARRPRLLIADEPTTALDVTTQARILDLLRGLVREFDMGLLMITHDLAVVSDLADTIAVMDQGAVVEAGETRDVITHRRHPYTARLFAASAHRVALPPPPPPAPLLRVEGVRRTYRQRQGLFGPSREIRAVDGVSFTLDRGERLGLVGESGCGKSTLARAILGLEPVTEGRITLAGSPVGTGQTRRHMQVVFQDPYSSFNPRHRVARLIAEPFHGLPDAPEGPARDAAIARALTDVGLSPADGDKFIHQFSGGQRQRIAIARALITEPDLILFDEAVSALDVSVRAQVLDLLADLCRRRGLGYLFISHDLTVIRSITDRVMVMQAGRIVEEGPTARVLSSPEHPYTAALIAAAPKLPDLAEVR